eukprot:CAMPEP_0180706022 /NCGR_PEP_ID=MMETSP1038_2-20121128/7980_1 /TAXON_ID=632150 /ORGANISM="Azadinium spinosum, Strain 3D9" /LENGTH=135 /DNA_ID=CAMNT_0022737919 /DNA_START=118 /DNA_END=526 /DNA_ORIENTATION=-
MASSEQSVYFHLDSMSSLSIKTSLTVVRVCRAGQLSKRSPWSCQTTGGVLVCCGLGLLQGKQSNSIVLIIGAVPKAALLPHCVPFRRAIPKGELCLRTTSCYRMCNGGWNGTCHKATEDEMAKMHREDGEREGLA